MDQERFDQLSRRLGATRTRRGALRALAGALVASVAGVKATVSEVEAAPCTGNYGSCQNDGQCCSGAVCEWGMCMPGCRIDGQFAHPGTSPAGNSCQVCNPAVSTTAGAPTNEGSPCWSGNAFAGPTYCQGGVCAPEGPQSCPPLTACHLEGEINPANGLCVSPPAPEGTPCGIGEMCHGGFYSPAATCDGDGHCIAGGSKTVNCAPYTCEGTACGTICGADSECTNGATCCGGQCLYPGDFATNLDHCGSCGNACAPIDSCTPVSCVDGICVSSQESVCAPVDACTPASCDNGDCNQDSVCTGFDTCGGGGQVGLCGCTPDCQTCGGDDGCGGVCEGQTATTPAISLTFEPSHNVEYCIPIVHLTGFEGCTPYTGEYWVLERYMGTFDPYSYGGVSVGTTDLNGSSQTPVGSYVSQSEGEQTYLEVRIGNVVSGWQAITCPQP